MADVKTEGIRVPVTLIVEMSGGQVTDYADTWELPADGGQLMARHMVAAVRKDAETAVRDMYGAGATVSLK